MGNFGTSLYTFCPPFFSPYSFLCPFFWLGSGLVPSTCADQLSEDGLQNDFSYLHATMSGRVLVRVLQCLKQKMHLY